MGVEIRRIVGGRERREHIPDPLEDDRSWHCPVCETAVLHRRRPGRRKVYCNNACKQRAYRWRRAHRERIDIEEPAERARGHGKVHALRSDADLVTARRTTRGHRVTACGAFARAARDDRRTADNNVFIPTPHRCASCRRVLDLPRPGPKPKVNYQPRLRARLSLSPGGTSPASRDRARSPWGR